MLESHALGEKSEALRLLSGLEQGSLSIADAYNIAKDRDPILVYFVIRYLREKYSPTDPAAAGVLQRVVELTGTYAEIVKMVREGERDAMKEWFDDAYNVRQFSQSPDEYLELIINKLES